MYIEKPTFQVLVLGLDGAGKTTVLEQLKKIYGATNPIDPNRIRPTVGLNVARLDTARARLLLWDLGGQQGLRSIWEKYYDDAHAVVYVVDSADQERFDECKQELLRVLKHDSLHHAPVLILANKEDLNSAIGSDKLEKLLSLEELGANHHSYKINQVSALKG